VNDKKSDLVIDKAVVIHGRRKRAMDVHLAHSLKKLWRGAFILTLAGLIVKILSAFYRVPYQNLVGDIGFYIYQQIYPFYGIALTLCTYGFPVVISKLISERSEREEDTKHIITVSFLFLFCLALAVYFFLYFGADFIASFMGDPKLSLLIQIISFSFLFVPFVSVLRGYFQGKGNMVPTAISQIAEQIIRVVTILLGSFILLSGGYGVYESGAGAVFGSITGGFASMFVLAFFWRKRERRPWKFGWKTSGVETKVILYTLIVEGITICISGLLLVLLQLVDSLSVYSLLVSSGWEKEAAKAAKGIFDRGQPLIQLGTVVATSLSLSLVPFISNAKVNGDRSLIKEKINATLRISLVTGLGASVGLACIIEPTNIMLFEDESGSTVLATLGISIVFSSLSLTMFAILQGLGHVYFPVFSVFIGLGVKWILNILLIPTLFTLGSAIATVISLFIITIMQYVYICKIYGTYFIQVKKAMHVCFAAVFMAGILYIYREISDMIFPFHESRMAAAWYALSSVAVGGIVYLWMIVSLGIFTRKELLLVPFGKKLERWIYSKK
jgi:polysaccharide transporter, PST family